MSRTADLARRLLDLDEFDLKIVLDAVDDENEEVISVLEKSIEEEI